MVIVCEALDIFLLPRPKGNFQNTDWFIFAGTQPVFLAAADPNLVAGLTNLLLIADLYNRAIVKDNPQLGAGSMRLQTQPLTGQHRHQADGAVLIVGELFE